MFENEQCLTLSCTPYFTLYSILHCRPSPMNLDSPPWYTLHWGQPTPISECLCHPIADGSIMFGYYNLRVHFVQYMIVNLQCL